MSISPARRVAFDVLLQVETQDAYASELLQNERLSRLSDEDRGLAHEIVMGVLRWRSQLDREIAEYSFTPFRKLDAGVLTALRAGIYQLRHLDRVPDHAVINDSVNMVKAAGKTSAAGLVNAVLRKVSRGKPLKMGSLAEDWAHPEWMVERWIKYYGEDTTRQILEHDQRRPGQHLRVRHGKPVEEMMEELANEGVACVRGELTPTCLRVVSGDATRTNAYRERRIAIQDEGSQWVAHLASTSVQSPSRILDCCAAPGGKTMALAEAWPEAQVIALELHAHRVEVLRRLCDVPNVSVTHVDATTYEGSEGFDLVLADVPCTGTGTLARHPEIKWRLKPSDISDLQQRQLAIAHSALRNCKRGATLVFSTCSLEKEEGEEVIDKIVRESGDCELIGEPRRLLPGEFDGFLAATLRRL